MKISTIVREQYKRLCKTSCEKSNGNEKEIDYKIQRCIELGKNVHTYEDGSKLIRYYHMNFHVSDYEIMSVSIDHSMKEFKVDDEVKKEYDTLHNKELKGLTLEQQLNSTLSKIQHFTHKRHVLDVKLDKYKLIADELSEKVKKQNAFSMYA